MSHRGYRGGHLVDEDDTGEIPREVLQAVLSRIRKEESLRQRALRAMRAQSEAFELEGSLDSAPAPHHRRLWSPARFFGGLGVAATVPALVLWWMLT